MIKQLIILVFITIELTGQLPIRVDYDVDLYMDCDSVIHYKYNNISAKEWDSITIRDKFDGKTALSKTVYYYKDSMLSLEKKYDMINGDWTCSSRTTYLKDRDDIIETTSAILGENELSITEVYKKDYVWITDLVPVELLSSEEAGLVLFVPSIKEKYKQELSKITQGKIENEIGDEG